MKNKGYNGHKNRAHWNVSLWIGNDEVLYNMAREHIKRCKFKGLTKVQAAENILDELRQSGIEKTPDGFKYSLANIRAAIVGM